MKMWKFSHTDVYQYGERQTMCHLMTLCCCPQLHVDRPGYSNPCRYQLCQTLGGIYLTVTIDDSKRKTHHKHTAHMLHQPQTGHTSHRYTAGTGTSPIHSSTNRPTRHTAATIPRIWCCGVILDGKWTFDSVTSWTPSTSTRICSVMFTNVSCSATVLHANSDVQL